MQKQVTQEFEAATLAGAMTQARQHLGPDCTLDRQYKSAGGVTVVATGTPQRKATRVVAGQDMSRRPGIKRSMPSASRVNSGMSGGRPGGNTATSINISIGDEIGNGAEPADIAQRFARPDAEVPAQIEAPQKRKPILDRIQKLIATSNRENFSREDIEAMLARETSRKGKESAAAIDALAAQQAQMLERMQREMERAFAERVDTITDTLSRSMQHLSEDRLRQSPARAAALEMLENFGLSADLAREITAEIDPGITEEDLLRNALIEQIAQRTFASDEDFLATGGIIALVGPTGVGKTTTAAKLAAEYARRYSARDVALVATDTKRAAAKEQLQSHGRRLGITVFEAEDAKSLRDVLLRAQDYPCVIIDTAGLSTSDAALITQLQALRSVGEIRPLLVLPAHGGHRDLRDLCSVYARIHPVGIVLTKADESMRLGGAVTAAKASGLPLVFICDGQHVTGDISAATADAITSRFVDLSQVPEMLAEEANAA